jgi:hypothetical protein
MEEEAMDRGESMTTWEVLEDLERCADAVNAAQRQLFYAIIRCDLRRAWIEDDCRDIVHFIALRLGISCWKARRWVNCAWRLLDLPAIADAFEAGELSIDKVVELTRFATPAEEKKLLAWARRVAVATIRDRADCECRIADRDVSEADKERSLKWWLDQDNARMSIYGSFPAADGAVITTAIDRLAAKMPSSPVDDVDEQASLEARRADALAALASQAISDDADSDRATVVVHAELSALTAKDGNGVVGGSLPIHPAVTQRIMCDCRYQPVLHGDDGLVVGIGKTARIIPRWLRRQVEHRDHHRCGFPNCGSRLGLDAHHVVPWPEGPTDIDNLTMLCRVHHKLVHDHGWHVILLADQTTRWFRPDRTPYQPRAGPARSRAEPERGPGTDLQESSADQQETFGFKPQLPSARTRLRANSSR